MALFNEITSIAFNEKTDLITVTHKTGTDNISCVNGQKLTFSRVGGFWDLEVNAGEIATPKFTLNLLKTHTNISFTSVFENGTWYYLLGFIGEEDIRDGFMGQGNVFYIGMLYEISIKSQGNQITILKS